LTPPDLLPGARKLLTVCTRTQPGEHVVIVTDPDTLPVAEALAAAAAELGAEPTVCLIPPRTVHGQEPPAPAAAALKAADVFFTPVRVSITHTQAVKDAVRNGARGLVMTDFTPEMLVHGGIEADFAARAPVCRRLAGIFEGGAIVHLTTPAGTDLRLNAAGRRGNALTGIVGPGEFSTIPTIEANFSPVEGSTEGVIVADASIPYLGIGLLETPVRAFVEGGSITAITGGAQAAVLRENLAAQADPNVYNIAELGVGLNPRARLCGRMLEDEGVLGVVHIGIGTSITLGGTVRAKIHYDLLMHEATLEVDGEVVLKDGKVLLEG
jgi:leucyl aminopeptidase (aminopeptidase T)